MASNDSSGVTIKPERYDPKPNTSSQYPTAWRLVIVLLSLALGTLLMAIDTTIISVGIPRISTDFKALNDVGWYGSGYLITLTAFQPVSGNVYRMFHPKVVYMVFIVIFEGIQALHKSFLWIPSYRAF
jgi:MFS family permease